MIEKGPIATPKKIAKEIDALIKSGKYRPETILAEIDNNPRITLQERDALRSRLTPILVNDLLALKKQNQSIQEEGIENMSTDHLTSLPNAAFLEYIVDNYRHRLEDEDDDRESGIEALMVITFDIAKFKQYNDTYGHEEGDKVILAVAKRLTEATRDTDEKFRPHGDEFVVVIPMYKKDKNFDPDTHFNKLKVKINKNLSAEVRNIIGADKIRKEEGIEVTRIVPVEVHMGYEIVKRGDKRTTKQILQRSDENMYTNKNESKRRASDK